MGAAARKARRAAEPGEPRAKILRARVEITSQGSDGRASTSVTDLPPEALAALEAASADVAEESAGPAPGDAAPTVAEVATAAQEAAQLRFCLRHAAPELAPAVDRLVLLLRRLPGVAEELQRRHLGRG
jgi:hypothetical protein